MLMSSKEKGQGLIKYLLILTLVAIVVIAALQILIPLVGEYGYSVTRFLARYWLWAVGIILLSFLGNVLAYLFVKWLKGE